MATIKSSYAAKATITVTLTSLANGSARECTVVDNTANLYLDALIRIKTNGSAAGNTVTVDVYAYAALGDTAYTDGATGSDAAFTAANRLNARYLGSVTLNGTTGVIAGPWSVAAAFGGTLPDKWGLIFVNNSGAALSATGGDHVVEYEGVTETIN
jgi:hypothetical protein